MLLLTIASSWLCASCGFYAKRAPQTKMSKTWNTRLMALASALLFIGICASTGVGTPWVAIVIALAMVSACLSLIAFIGHWQPMMLLVLNVAALSGMALGLAKSAGG